MYSKHLQDAYENKIIGRFTLIGMVFLGLNMRHIKHIIKLYLGMYVYVYVYEWVRHTWSMNERVRHRLAEPGWGPSKTSSRNEGTLGIARRVAGLSLPILMLILR